MKVFISWSGERSRQVAELLKFWLQCVVQSVEPWVSSQDIDRGALWYSELSDQLNKVTIGIICLTSENKEKPWILFEAGALTKGLTSNKVIPLLIDLSPEDVQVPLAQFNLTQPTKEGLFKLVLTINNQQNEKLSDEILKTTYETFWSQFELSFKKILFETETGQLPPERPKEDILTEVLSTIRSMDKRMRSIELGTIKRPASLINVGTYLSQKLKDHTDLYDHSGNFRKYYTFHWRLVENDKVLNEGDSLYFTSGSINNVEMENIVRGIIGENLNGVIQIVQVDTITESTYRDLLEVQNSNS